MLVFTSTANTHIYLWLKKYRLTRATNACVGFKQSRSVFCSACRCSTLMCIDQVVRLLCSQSLCSHLSLSPWSSSAWCYYWVIRLPSFPVSATAVNVATQGKNVFSFFFFLVRACVPTWLDGWMTVREAAQCVLSSQRNVINELVFFTGSWCNEEYQRCEGRFVFPPAFNKWMNIFPT